MAAVGGMLATGSRHAFAIPTSSARALAFENLHTHEHLSLVYAIGDAVLPQAQLRLDYFLRDHYTGEVGTIDPQLFDLLYHPIRIRDFSYLLQPKLSRRYVGNQTWSRRYRKATWVRHELNRRLLLQSSHTWRQLH